MKIFITDDPPGMEGAIRKILSEAEGPLGGLHTIRHALHKVRRRDREALAQDLKAVSGAETEEEAKGALRKL